MINKFSDDNLVTVMDKTNFFQMEYIAWMKQVLQTLNTTSHLWWQLWWWLAKCWNIRGRLCACKLHCQEKVLFYAGLIKDIDDITGERERKILKKRRNDPI